MSSSPNSSIRAVVWFGSDASSRRSISSGRATPYSSTKTPPASFLLQRACGINKGSGEPNRIKVGTVTMSQVEEIANIKMPDLNANDIEAAKQQIRGTARSMGIAVS